MIGSGYSNTFSYDINANSWSRTKYTSSGYSGDHVAAVADPVNNVAYFIGGLNGNFGGKVVMFSPGNNKWTQLATVPQNVGSTNAVLIDKILYICGGIVGSNTISNCWTFNPTASSNSFGNIASMPYGVNHAAYATDGSKFFVFGGRGGGNTPSNGYDYSQVYNPGSDSWTLLKALPQARGGMGCAVWANGEFYVIGGETLNGSGASSNKVYDRVDIYSPTSNSWRSGPKMLTARHGIYPVYFASQKIIVVAAGGTHNAGSASNVNEILHI